jgi:hypothetical protein
MVKFASVLNVEPFELFKPADAPPATVSSLLAKYNDEVIHAVFSSIKQVHSYYQAQLETKPEPQKQVREKTRRSR